MLLAVHIYRVMDALGSFLSIREARVARGESYAFRDLWAPNLILPELNSIIMQTFPFVSMEKQGY